MAGVGDSITVENQLTLNLQFITANPTASFAVNNKMVSFAAWLWYGAMRSGGSWAAFEFNPSYSGARSDQVLATVVPTLLAYPYGQPNAAEVMVGTNDVGQGVPTATIIANIKAIYNALLGAGITPIAATILPTATNQAACMALNLAIMGLAREYNIPIVDYYSALATETGAWRSSNWTADNVHPTGLGAAIMGYLLNQTVQGWWGSGGRNQVNGLYGYGGGFSNADPLLQTHAGTINSASSYPSGNGWGVPASPSLFTLFNGAGSENGGLHTPYAATPALFGSTGLNLPNYLGNAMQILGDGASNVGLTAGPTTPFTCAVGDKLALAMRIKWTPNLAATLPGTWFFQVNVGSAGAAFGFNYQTVGSNSAAGATIGNEAAYPAGDFYQEYTCLVPGACSCFYGMGNNNTNPTNLNDCLTFSNIRLINLTKAGLVAP